MKPRLKMSIVVMAVLLVACDSLSPTSAIVTVAPALTETTTLPTHTAAPTDIPTLIVTPTPSVPHPITWTVQQSKTADGQTTYLVDDPGVIRAAQMGYERLREYYTFPDGLPAKEQIEQDLAQLIVDPDRVRGAVEQLEQIRSKGGYWILPPLTAYQWTDTADFNADGSQVSLSLTAPTYHAEFFSLASGTVTFTENDEGFSVKVTLVYDEFSGQWKLLSEQSSFQQRGPVVTVTPVP